MFTARAVSQLSTGEVWISLLALTTVYAALGVVEVFLMRKYIRGGVDAVLPPSSDQKPDQGPKPQQDGDSDDQTLAFAY